MRKINGDWISDCNSSEYLIEIIDRLNGCKEIHQIIGTLRKKTKADFFPIIVVLIEILGMLFTEEELEKEITKYLLLKNEVKITSSEIGIFINYVKMKKELEGLDFIAKLYLEMEM